MIAAPALRRPHLLPPQSTELERAFDETLPAWDTLANAFTPPSQGEPEGFAPWLAAEYALADFAPYFASTPELLQEGLRWLFVRGTAAAALQALGWVGFAGAAIEEEGPYLHIDLGRLATAAEMQRVAHVVRASLPAHVAFYRVHHGHDVRPVVVDRGPALDAGMLDGYSGVAGASGIVESFGARRGGTAPACPASSGSLGARQVRVSVSRYDDMPVLDAWRLDSRVLSGLSGGVMALSTYSSNAPPTAAGAFTRRGIPSSASPWIAPAPLIALRSTVVTHEAVPIHPARRWAGRWTGAWRQHFTTTHTEET